MSLGARPKRRKQASQGYVVRLGPLKQSKSVCWAVTLARWVRVFVVHALGLKFIPHTHLSVKRGPKRAPCSTESVGQR